MRAWILAFVLIAGGLTGCIGTDGDEVGPTAANETGSTDDPSAETADANTTQASASLDRQVDVSWLNGSIQGAGNPTANVYTCSPMACDNTLEFTLEEDATAIVIEGAWNASTSMELTAVPPFEKSCEPVAPMVPFSQCSSPDVVTGSSPLRIEVTSDEFLAMTGDWVSRLWADQALTEPVDITLVATVIYDGTPPGEVGHVSG